MRLVQRLLGLFLIGYSLSLLPPIGISLLYHDGHAGDFLDSIVLCVGTGFLCWWPVRHYRRDLTRRDGYVIVATFWITFSLICAIPFLLAPALSFPHALFESISGFTTTGATVIVGLDRLPPSVLFYRQQLQWLGGMGIVLLGVAVAPLLGVGGMQLYRAETPGPMKDEKLTPRIAHTAQALWRIYLALTLLCTLGYKLAGMSLFDAIGHAFSTLSTGGFSTHDASFAWFDNPGIEIVATVFMMLGSMNFSVHYLAATNRSLRTYLEDSECLSFLGIVIVTILVIAGVLAAKGPFTDFPTALRHAMFQVVSVITTTGYTTTDFSVWPLFAPVLLIFISFVGGCAGSTAGGMKVIRWLLIIKQGAREIALLVHPRGNFSVKINRRPMPDAVVHAVWGFFSVYTITFVLLMLLLMATGEDQVTAFSAIATCINNLGPGLGAVSSNFVSLNEFGIYVCCAAMLLGRLEVFTVLVLLSPYFWRS